MISMTFSAAAHARGLPQNVPPMVPGAADSMISSPAMIAESGILGDEDVRYLKETGANGFLIGRALMESENPKQVALHWKRVYREA